MNPRWLSFVAIMLSAMPAAAQEHARRGDTIEYRFEVFGSMGWGRRGADEGSLGGGPLLAAGFGFRPLRRVGFEVEASFASHQRDFASGVTFEGEAFSVAGNVLYHFSESRTQWFVLGGLGWVSEDHRSIFRSRLPDDDTSFRYSDDYAVWGVGFGLKTLLTGQLLLRPEFRYTGGGPFGVSGLLRLTVGLGYVW